MERKRELTSVDLAALVGELRGYCDAMVGKVYRYDDDLIRLRMRHYERGRLELLIEVGDVKRAHISAPEHVPDAPPRPPNFAKMLRNRLTSATWTGVEQHGFDRVLVFEFEHERGNTTLVAELFGEGNVVVCDETGQIVDALRTVRLTSRTIAPGSPYQFPERQLNPFDLTREQFMTVMRSSDTDIVRTLATQVNLGGRFAEELCSRAGVPKERSIEGATDDTLSQLYTAIVDIGEIINDRSFDARVYYEDEVRVDVAPIPLEDLSHLPSDRFDRFNDAVDDYFTHFSTSTPEEDRPDVDEEIERRERIIEQQSAAITEFEEEAARTHANAEALYAHYDMVDDILTTIQSARGEGRSWDEIEQTFAEAAAEGHDRAAAVTGLSGERHTVSIDLGSTEVELDATTGVEQNADRLYIEAKRIREKREGAEDALAETKAELEDVRSRREDWKSSPPEDIDDAEEIEWVSRPSIPVKRSDEWYERFRWFHTSDEFLVIGGRNADQNEELVSKYLEPGDRFIHAEAHGAPVTILKATGPSEAARDVTFPERTVAEAAQFAVSYSSLWKEGLFAGDAYLVDPEQVSKQPESGEYVQKGSFVVRGEREYHRNVEVGVAVGIACEPLTRVIGGPPTPIHAQAPIVATVRPGDVAATDVAKRIYRQFREAFQDTSFVQSVASTEEIQRFLPPGRSAIVDE